jgi:PfaB family protein
VVGEGAGILVLKRLSDALACGDEIHGLVQTVGLSNDMRGNLLSPEVEGQVRAMEAAYAAAGWSPDQVDLVECHGTGTPVGDAVELQSLRRIREQTPGIPGGTPIGSVKSNVGHLLTAAGAAGLVKILLALKHRTLPPQAHFREAAPDSPLHAGPFRVQTKAAPWEAPRDGRPRRAAVSAFGFGGINAHLLVEEFQGTRDEGRRARGRGFSVPRPSSLVPPEPVAIVGMDIRVGPLDGLRAFQEALFNGRPAFRRRPESRWRGADDFAFRLLGERGGNGAYLESVAVRPGEFGVPPREIPDILPQQLLMLQAAAGALADAGLSERTPRPRAGVAVGMDFDPEACAFHLRWSLENRVDEWRRRMGAEPADDGWLAALRDACGPPLTAARTLGALGGVVASRVAREFRLGGPSFTVSAEAASGLRALEIAVRSLRVGETDLHIAGAVDLAGDLRHVAATGLRAFGSGDRVRPFDASADGTLPGDGAAALVLKRLSDAKADGDRVYAVVRGLGFASGGGIDPVLPAPDVYARALRTALAEAGFAPETVGLVAAHGTGDSEEDPMEIAALREVLGGGGATPPHRDGEAARVALASAASVSGYVGAASGLISAAAAALCLFREILPPVPGFVEPAEPLRDAEAFHLPASPAYWFRNRVDGPRRAVAAAMTRDGNCGHVVLEAAAENDHGAVPEPVARQRRRPLGECPAALFVATGNTTEELFRKLDDLERHLRGPVGSGSSAAPDSLDAAARSWFRRNDPNDSGRGPALALVLRGRERIGRWLAEARRALSEGTPRKIVGPEGLAFFPKPLGPQGEVAFVYPGSGSHYVGMGRGLAVRWPDAVRSLDAETGHLRSQALPELYAPWRRSWSEGWEADAHRRIVSDPVHMLFGQVFHGSLVTRLANFFGIRPDAVIGYSLGETAGYFATGAWTGRGEMLRRMRETDLFRHILHGRCEAARAAWGIPPDADFRWRVAVFNRPADEVRRAMAGYPRTRLLIANTPEECVAGGDAEAVGALARDLGLAPIDLDGVTTVHCDAVLPAAEAYRALHLFPTAPPAGVRYYSAAFGEARAPTREGAADSILRQAADGFDFPRIVERAYADGVRIFLEMGPQASCKRMIGRILGDRPHTALSACVRGEDDELTILKFLGNLIAERVPVNLEALYGESAMPPENAVEPRLAGIAVIAGGPAPAPPPPPGIRLPRPAAPSNPKKGTEASLRDDGKRKTERIPMLSHDMENPVPTASEASFRDLVRNRWPPWKVLGPEFDIVDTFKARVRLPDEPLMLVDRILVVEGEKRGLGAGRVVTEHDVRPGAWYLDGDARRSAYRWRRDRRTCSCAATWASTTRSGAGAPTACWTPPSASTAACPGRARPSATTSTSTGSSAPAKPGCSSSNSTEPSTARR